MAASDATMTTAGDVTIVTSFSPEGYAEYARTCLCSTVAYWPCDILAYVHHEPPDFLSRKVTFYDLEMGKAFLDFRAEAAEHPSPTTSYRYDAVKFAHKVFTLWYAAERVKTPWMVWLDADVETRKHVPETFFADTLLPWLSVVYLGRPWFRHSECGFLAFNLAQPKARQVIQEMADVYRTGKLYDLGEWHDSYVFDLVRKAICDPEDEMSISDPECRDLDVWETSPLGVFSEHHKGARKAGIRT